MNVETWIVLAVSAVIIPAVGWLLKEVLAHRDRLVELETRLEERDKNCERHQKWNGDLQRSLQRMDKNISRLCQHAGIPESPE